MQASISNLSMHLGANRVPVTVIILILRALATKIRSFSLWVTTARFKRSGQICQTPPLTLPGTFSQARYYENHRIVNKPNWPIPSCGLLRLTHFFYCRFGQVNQTIRSAYACCFQSIVHNVIREAKVQQSWINTSFCCSLLDRSQKSRKLPFFAEITHTSR